MRRRPERESDHFTFTLARFLKIPPRLSHGDTNQGRTGMEGKERAAKQTPHLAAVVASDRAEHHNIAFGNLDEPVSAALLDKHVVMSLT